MQGKKDYQEKLFASFQLSERIPKDNFYRRSKGAIDLDFLYPLTKGYYGESGQKSIDPVVFFKLCLVGYLENIISDRKLIDHCSMRSDIPFFIGYDTTKNCHGTVRSVGPVDFFPGPYSRKCSPRCWPCAWKGVW